MQQEKLQRISLKIPFLICDFVLLDFYSSCKAIFILMISLLQF